MNTIHHGVRLERDEDDHGPAALVQTTCPQCQGEGTLETKPVHDHVGPVQVAIDQRYIRAVEVCFACNGEGEIHV